MHVMLTVHTIESNQVCVVQLIVGQCWNETLNVSIIIIIIIIMFILNFLKQHKYTSDKETSINV